VVPARAGVVPAPAAGEPALNRVTASADAAINATLATSAVSHFVQLRARVRISRAK
jgi:hypothetical protein